MINCPSGNSRYILLNIVVLCVLSIRVIGLTGADGVELSTLSDVCVRFPSIETLYDTGVSLG